MLDIFFKILLCTSTIRTDRVVRLTDHLLKTKQRTRTEKNLSLKSAIGKPCCFNNPPPLPLPTDRTIMHNTYLLGILPPLLPFIRVIRSDWKISEPTRKHKIRRYLLRMRVVKYTTKDSWHTMCKSQSVSLSISISRTLLKMFSIRFLGFDYAKRLKQVSWKSGVRKQRNERTRIRTPTLRSEDRRPNHNTTAPDR